MASGAAPAMSDDDPELVLRSYLDSDEEPLIPAATAGQLRDTLVAIADHLGRQLHLDVAQFPAYGPDERPPWAVCQTGNAMRAGFQIYHEVIQALAGGFLAVMSFDAAQAVTDPAYHAAVIVPSLAGAGKARMRTILTDLAGHVRATASDSAASTGLLSASQVPADIRDVASGVTTAISLYHHAVVAEAANVLYLIWDGLQAPNLAAVTSPAACGLSLN
jgi:hypothetical protein